MRTTSWPRPTISFPTRFTRSIASATSRTPLPHGGLGFSVYGGENVTRAQVPGLDFDTGKLSHSIRFGYLKTERDLNDASRGSGLPFSTYPLNIQMGNTGLLTGPNFVGPEAILQSNHQFKYDGSKTLGPHIIRCGFDFNRIAAAGSVPLGSLARLSSRMLVPPRRPSHKRAHSRVGIRTR